MDAPFTEEEVLKALRDANLDTAAGEDGVPSFALRDLSETSLSSLIALFNLCLQHRVTPSDWAMARIQLIPKSGDPTDCANYRRNICDFYPRQGLLSCRVQTTDTIY